MRHPLLIPDLRELLKSGEAEGLREFFDEYEPPRMAELIEDLGPEEGTAALALLEPRTRAEVVSYLDADRQVELVESMQPDGAAELLHHMPHDDRADLVNRLDEDRAELILRRLAQADRDDIRKLLSYEPGTAGSVMTTEYTTLPPYVTAREAIDLLRKEAPDRETILTSYVVDPHRRLLGSISLQQIILARPTARLEDVMQTDPISAKVDDDREEVAKKIERYDLLALPIIDAEDRLVGIVTHDDAMDILRQEQAQDILQFGGVSPDPQIEDQPYWLGSPWYGFRRRIKWLMLLFLAENFTYPVLEHFAWLEGDDYFPPLKFFVALLIGTGGNAGSQTVGTIIRGLALGEIEWGDLRRVLLREWLTGVLLGVSLGAFGLIYAHFYRGQSWGISLVVAFALMCICMWANLIGSLVPMIARRLGIDPAVISAPFITTLVDATGLLIYYSIAMFILLHLKL